MLPIDWKENLSLPMAGLEQEPCFRTSERIPVSCFGAAVYHRPEDSFSTRVHYCVFLSDILDHTCVMSGFIMSRVLSEILPDAECAAFPGA
jgi:hypothetical protein